MDRRHFIRHATVGAAGAGLASATAGSAFAQDGVTRWRLQSAFPRSLTEFYELFDGAMARIGKMTDKKFLIQGFAPGEIVPVPGILTAVGNGTIEAGFTAGYFYTGIDKTFAFVTGIPFGMNARLQLAWFEYGGGKEILQELFDKHNLVHFQGGNTGSQMGGFFKKEIKSAADLKGLKMRIPGFGGEVLGAVGVVPQMIPPGDVYTALEKGTLDAAEFTTPVQDEKLGFHQVAKFYYTMGFWDYASMQSFWVNKDHWKALPETHRQAFISGVKSQAIDLNAMYDATNMEPMRRMLQKGVQLRAMPKDVMDVCYEAAFDLYETEANRNPLFKKVYTHWSQFREKAFRWYSMNETPMDQFVSSQIAKRRKT